jgi:hypothetical protein
MLQRQNSDPSPFGISHLERPADPIARLEDCARRSSTPDDLMLPASDRRDRSGWDNRSLAKSISAVYQER